MSQPLSEHLRIALDAALRNREPATDEDVRRAVSDALSVGGHSHTPLIHERLMRAEVRVPAIVRRLLDAEARLANAELPPSGEPSAEEYRLAQYAQPPRVFESATERALFEIAIGLRQILHDTRLRRDDARAGREDAEADAERLRTELAKYVGHEPTLAEEAEYVRREHRSAALTEAATVAELFLGRWPDMDAMKADGITGPFTALGALADELRRMAASDRAGKDTDGGTQPPAGESTQPFVPRTEREHWVAIAEALNAAGAAGISVGIDMEGILTDHLAWAVVWNREAQHWEVGGYEDESPAETPASAEDWVICCSPKPRCPNGERRARAVERGWTQNGRAGNWLCAEHSPDFFKPGRTYRYHRWQFRCDTVTTHPQSAERRALGWFRSLDGTWAPYTGTDGEWSEGSWTEAGEAL